MLQSVYLYVWMLAYFGYLALLSSFLCAKRNNLVNSVTVLLVFGTLWVFANLSMRLGVRPSPRVWFVRSELCIILIPLLVYRVIRVFAGLDNKVRHLFVLWAIAVVLIAMVFFDIYFAPTFNLVNMDLVSPLVIENIYTVRMNPRYGSILLGVYSSLIVFLSLRIIYKHPELESRTLLSVGVLAFWVMNMFAMKTGADFPFELLGSFVSGYIIISLMKDRQSLDYKDFVNHTTFAVFSVLAIIFLCVLLYFKDWGSQKNYMRHVIESMIVASLATAVMTIFYEFLYSRFFVDRGKFLLRCNFEYHDELLPKLGEVEAIASLFSYMLEKSFGKTNVALYIFDEKEDEYRLKDESGTRVSSFPRNHEIVNHALNLKGLQSAWNVVGLMDEGHDRLREAIEERKLVLFAPLKVNDNVVGFYFLGGDRISSLDKKDKDALSAVTKTTAMAIESSVMMHTLERDAVTDQLTGLYDRHTSREFLKKYMKRSRPFVFLLFNIDDMKLFNMVYTIREGDNLLKVFADCLRAEADERVTLCRISGKTFGAYIDGNRELAIDYDERVRRRFVSMNEGTIRSDVSFSTGMLVIREGETRNEDQLLDAVKIAEVQAKKNGKNRLFEYQDYMAEDPDKYDVGFRIGTVDAISKALDLRDHLTYGHSDNVAIYARGIAQAIGLNPMECQVIFEAGLVHDIGKISIPDSILLNTGKLTDEEYEIMKTHVERGRDVIESLPNGYLMLPIAMAHHERWDGKGYPNGLKGEEIPIGGRCLAIADTFDAMTSRRVYKKALSVEEALTEIERVSGSQLDPVLGPLFVRLVRDGKIVPNPET